MTEIIEGVEIIDVEAAYFWEGKIKTTIAFAPNFMPGTAMTVSALDDNGKWVQIGKVGREKAVVVTGFNHKGITFPWEQLFKCQIDSGTPAYFRVQNIVNFNNNVEVRQVEDVTTPALVIGRVNPMNTASLYCANTIEAYAQRLDAGGNTTPLEFELWIFGL